MTVLGEAGRGGLGVVGAGRSADRSVSGSTDNAVLQVCRKLGGVVVDVPTIAEQDVRYAGVGERLLCPSVLLADEQRGAGGVADAGLGDQLYACSLRGGDDIRVLFDALPYLGAGHQKKPIGARKCLTERRLIGVVGAAYGYALVSEVAKGLDAAARGDDLVGWDAST